MVLWCCPFCRPHEPARARAVHQEDPAASVRVYAWWDLPGADPRSHELSGIAWDWEKHVLYAIADKTPQIVELVPDAGLQNWKLGERTPIHIPEPWDGEGLAVTRDGFILSSEAGPGVYEVSRSGEWRSTVPLPRHFERSRHNLSLESLSVTEDGRYLFTANEQALSEDGPTTSRQQGTLVRILRHDRVTGAQVEFAYRTDPLFVGQGDGELGVVDLAALSPQELLVMERSYVPGAGNSVRIYRVSTAASVSTLTVEHLRPDTPVLQKTLYADLSTLPDRDFPEPKRPQENRILANFEGMALGPRIASRQRLLFLISDDNTSSTQQARLLVLKAKDL